MSLHVGYAYLPTSGTLVVNAKLIPSAQGMAEEEIQCAIHYVDDGDVRYCVRPVSAGRAEPIRPLQEGETLMDRAQSAGWAHAGHGAFEGPNGETLQGALLSVRVGTAWSPYDEGEEPEAPADATSTAQPRAEHAQGGLTAGRKEILEGPSGLDPILESGEFQVTGTVYFRPLQPFDLNPTIPGAGDQSAGRSESNSGKQVGRKGPDPKFVSEQQFSFDYPEDADK